MRFVTFAVLFVLLVKIKAEDDEKEENCQPVDKIYLDVARKDGLGLHNIFRQWHNLPRLVLDDALNEKAQKHAQESNSDAVHADEAGTEEEDENAAVSTWEKDKVITPGEQVEASIRLWYFETCKKSQTDEDLDHFASIVLKDSIKLGIGMTKCETPTHIIYHVVALYSSGKKYDRAEQLLPNLRCDKKAICTLGEDPTSYTDVQFKVLSQTCPAPNSGRHGHEDHKKSAGKSLSACTLTTFVLQWATGILLAVFYYA